MPIKARVLSTLWFVMGGGITLFFIWKTNFMGARPFVPEHWPFSIFAVGLAGRILGYPIVLKASQMRIREVLLRGLFVPAVAVPLHYLAGSATQIIFEISQGRFLEAGQMFRSALFTVPFTALFVPFIVVLTGPAAVLTAVSLWWLIRRSFLSAKRHKLEKPFVDVHATSRTVTLNTEGENVIAARPKSVSFLSLLSLVIFVLAGAVLFGFSWLLFYGLVFPAPYDPYGGTGWILIFGTPWVLGYTIISVLVGIGLLKIKKK